MCLAILPLAQQAQKPQPEVILAVRITPCVLALKNGFNWLMLFCYFRLTVRRKILFFYLRSFSFVHDRQEQESDLKHLQNFGQIIFLPFTQQTFSRCLDTEHRPFTSIVAISLSFRRRKRCSRAEKERQKNLHPGGFKPTTS